MIALIKHLWDNHKSRIVERSLLDCHCKGLHSIMLLESPEQTIRLYYAAPGNLLYKNSPDFLEGGMSIGFHAHHCNLTLHCVKGTLYNWVVLPSPDAVSNQSQWKILCYLRHYGYTSAITSDSMGFSFIDQVPIMDLGVRPIVANDFMIMEADEVHTVFCNPFEETAWLVYEGKEDPNYKSEVYTSAKLEDVDNSGLYRKAPFHTVRGILNSVFPELSI